MIEPSQAMEHALHGTKGERDLARRPPLCRQGRRRIVRPRAPSNVVEKTASSSVT
jgi:hypothetical protein